jgi:hypothetical protein
VHVLGSTLVHMYFIMYVCLHALFVVRSKYSINVVFTSYPTLSGRIMDILVNFGFEFLDTFEIDDYE